MAILPPLSVRFLSPSIIVKGVDTLVAVDIERDGAAVSMEASPTLTVYNAAGVIHGPYSASYSGTTLSATVLGDDTTSADFSGRWMCRWDFEVTSDRVYAPYNAAALCATDLACPVGVTDLVDRHTQMTVLLSTAATVQKKITQAWHELLSKMYADETPFWAARSASTLRPWLIERSRELCFEDMATAHPSGAVYATQATNARERLEALYNDLRIRLDDDQNNTLTARAVPAHDPRNMPPRTLT